MASIGACIGGSLTPTPAQINTEAGVDFIASPTTAYWMLGDGAAFAGGSASGTYFGIDAAANGADLVNFQVAGAARFSISTAGNALIAGTLGVTGAISAGASGTAGSVSIFPGTAAKGKTTFTSSNNTGNTTTTINVAAQATTRTYTVPDAGASASFCMTQGTTAIAGAWTFGSTITVTGATALNGATTLGDVLTVAGTTTLNGAANFNAVTTAAALLLSSYAPVTNTPYAVRVSGAPLASSAGALFAIGDGNFTHGGADPTGGDFVGSASGTLFGLNALTGYVGNLIDAQVNGTSVFSVSSLGNLALGGNIALAAGKKVAFDKGTVTQQTSATTAVTLNAQAGAITTVSETLGAGLTVSFTLNNSLILDANSIILISKIGGTNARFVNAQATATGAGTATITIANVDLLNALNGTVILGFIVIP